MNRFIEAGRLTDYHKCQINTKQLLNRLNQIAKEKVNERNRTRRTIQNDR